MIKQNNIFIRYLLSLNTSQKCRLYICDFNVELQFYLQKNVFFLLFIVNVLLKLDYRHIILGIENWKVPRNR